MNVQRFVLILIAGMVTIYQLVFKIDSVFFFDGIIDAFIVIVAVIILACVVKEDISDYRTNKSFNQLWPAITGGIFVIAIAVSLYVLNQRDNIPTIISANCSGDFNGTTIELRANGTYKLTNYCMGADYFRGKYTLKDSIIVLDRSEIDDVIKSNRLVIRPESFVPGTGLMIYQIDQQGHVLKNETEFQVQEDKRR